MKHGPYERNVFDFWKAESKGPTPLLVFIHGGGFVSGDKSRADASMIRGSLAAGVSFMAINYRFRKDAAIQDILRDADPETPEGRKALDDCSMLRQITRDDAPIFMASNMPDGDAKTRGQYVHHPRHAQAVQKQCQVVGVECVVLAREDLPSQNMLLLDFLLKHLGVEKTQPANGQAATK